MGLHCPLLDRGLSVSEGWPQGGRRARRGEAGRASGASELPFCAGAACTPISAARRRGLRVSVAGARGLSPGCSSPADRGPWRCRPRQAAQSMHSATLFYFFEKLSFGLKIKNYLLSNYSHEFLLSSFHSLISGGAFRCSFSVLISE